MAPAREPWRVVEHFGFDWAVQAVHIDLDEEMCTALAASERPLAVLDEAGTAVSAQLERTDASNRLWYTASLRPGEAKRYRIAADPTPRPSPLRVQIADDTAVLSNAAFAVRISWISMPSSARRAS
ncbi:MAG TPA: hypothetical protein HPP77_04570 [Candidatus Hydrogenedentes bacterium]|nr:hypothetical protein [Candidatus Hydrogenedentota bacterium]HIJ74100.1 hypothetical protein [Candidatus Hydrogenedentota bacterium]